MDQQRVVARNGHVVQEDRGVGRAPDRDPFLFNREALPRAPATGADHEGGARLADLRVDVDRRVLTRLIDLVGHRRGLVGSLGPSEVGAALLAVIGALGVDEAAFRTVNGHLSWTPLPAVWGPSQGGCR
jgi:hypothetical protein